MEIWTYIYDAGIFLQELLFAVCYDKAIGNSDYILSNVSIIRNN